MKNSHLFLFLLAGVSLEWVSSSFVELSEFGYTNLLVKIDDDVPASGCELLIKNLTENFVEASQSLCTATDRKAFFGNIAVLIPDSWMQVPECFKEVTVNLSWPRSYKADINLGMSHPLYGSNPFTLQYGGCGDESLPIRLSVDFLSNPKKGIELLHEWFHYRYGVFDESGIANDPLYPASYNIYNQKDNSVLPTSCSNIPLVGRWNQSTWQMNEDENKNVNSSIMYTTQLSSIELPCSHETHSKASPTKQNLQCNSKSVGEVMLSHRDFTGEPFYSCGKPTVTLVSNPVRGYHVILDLSSFMSESLEDAKFAISHFVWFLPDGFIFSLDSYGDTYESIVTPIALNRTNANKAIESIQKLWCYSNNSTAGLAIALNHSIDLFHSGMEIVIVTATPSGDLSESAETFGFERIIPHIITLNRRSMESFSTLAHNGGLYLIPDLNELTDTVGVRTRRTWLVDTLHFIYSRMFKYRAKVNEETLILTQQQTNGTFHVDASSGSLIFAFYDLGANYAFEFIQGFVYSPSGNHNCPISQMRSLPELFRTSCNITEAGTWSYSITLEIYGTTQIRLDVWMENNDALKIETWTSAPMDSPADIDKLIIYAFVTLGQRPVSNVDLFAHIYGDNETQPLLLHLNENNAYDLTLNDGIYSAIVTQLPLSSTAFSYVIEVNSTGQMGTETNGYHASAGSVIPLKNPTNVGRFKRYVYGGSFYLAEPYNSEDIWPPERVKDLTVTELSWANLTFTLGWSAVNDDHGTSSIAIYNYRITLEEESALGEDVYFVGDLVGNSVNNWMTYTVKLPTANHSRKVYVRVYGIDLNGNIADPSNTITISIDSEKDKTSEEGLPPALFWTLIGVGCATFLFVCGVIVYLVVKRCAKKRKENSAKTWIKHGDEGLSKKVKIGTPEINVFESHSFRSSFSSNWSNNSQASCDDEVFIHPVTIESHQISKAVSNDSDNETTSVESIIYTIPTNKLTTNGQSNVLRQKKRPPMPPPRRYFKDTVTPSPAQINEETDSSGSSIQYMTPDLNGNQTWEDSVLRRATIERYFAILGVDSEASLV